MKLYGYLNYKICNYSQGPILKKNLQHKFYGRLIFKHPDWLINLSSQSECLKMYAVKCL